MKDLSVIFMFATFAGGQKYVKENPEFQNRGESQRYTAKVINSKVYNITCWFKHDHLYHDLRVDLQSL